LRLTVVVVRLYANLSMAFQIIELLFLI